MVLVPKSKAKIAKPYKSHQPATEEKSITMDTVANLIEALLQFPQELTPYLGNDGKEPIPIGSILTVAANYGQIVLIAGTAL
jgi:hypothetical protein